MTRTLSLMIVIGGATALVVFMMAQGHDPIGGLLRQDEMASLGIKLIWAVFFGGLVLAAFRGKLSRAIEAIFLWGLIAVLIGVGYTYRYELSEVADRVLAELIPGRTATRGNSVEVVPPASCSPPTRRAMPDCRPRFSAIQSGSIPRTATPRPRR